jgi:hypothetical protein
MQAGSGDTYSLADVLGHFSALRISGGITQLSLAHLVDWRTTVVSLIARTRLSERASRVSICRWHLPPRKATNSCGRLLPRSGPPRPRDLPVETPNAAKTF